MDTDMRFILRHHGVRDKRVSDALLEILDAMPSPLQAMKAGLEMLSQHTKTSMVQYLFRFEVTPTADEAHPSTLKNLRMDIFADSKLWIKEFPHSKDIYVTLEIEEMTPGVHGFMTGADPRTIMQACLEYTETHPSEHPADQMFVVFAMLDWYCRNLEVLTMPEVIDDVFVMVFYDKDEGIKVTFKHDVKAVIAYWEAVKNHIDSGHFKEEEGNQNS